MSDLLLTNLLLSGEGTYVTLTREVRATDANFNQTNTNSTVINSVLGDLQFSAQPRVDAAEGIRLPQTWNLYTDPLSLVTEKDHVTIIGSDGVFQVDSLTQWQDHWEFRLKLRD